jgi:hypothetical protein
MSFAAIFLFSVISFADTLPYVDSKWEIVNGKIANEISTDIHTNEIRVCALVCDPDDVNNLNNAVVMLRVFYPNGTEYKKHSLAPATGTECIKPNPNTSKCKIYTTIFTMNADDPVGDYTIIVWVEYSPKNATQSIIKGANRLVANQNSDGGWGWPTGGESCTNLAGVTAMGLYYAFKITYDQDYMNAMEKALYYIKTHPPTYNEQCKETGDTCFSPGEESNRGSDSNKDILFLAHLALLRNDDSIANLAKTRYEGKRNCFNPTDPIKGAKEIANETFILRYSQGIPAVALWDVGDWVRALYKLSEYPGMDYRLEADAMVDLMKKKLDEGYFNINNLSQHYYYIGLVGIAEALATTGKYSDLLNQVKQKLLDGQDSTGYWPGDEDTLVDKAQTTAYAKMILDIMDEKEKAALGMTWLVNNQNDDGYWGSGSSEEYDEVTSEAVWAISSDISKQSRFKHLGVDVKRLKDKLIDLQNENARLNNEVGDLKSRISTLEGTILDLNGWKTRIENEIKGIWNKLEALQNFVQSVLSCARTTFLPFYNCMSGNAPEPWEQHCGDGVCQWDKGETPTSCPQDCEQEIREDGTIELKVAESWKVKCPESFTVDSTIYRTNHCRAELWKYTWKVSERRLNVGEEWQVNKNAGYFIKLYANATKT